MCSQSGLRLILYYEVCIRMADLYTAKGRLNFVYEILTFDIPTTGKRKLSGKSTMLSCGPELITTTLG